MNPALAGTVMVEAPKGEVNGSPRAHHTMSTIVTDVNERCDICRAMYPHNRVQSVQLDARTVRVCDGCREDME